MAISVLQLYWTAGFLEGDGSFGINKSGSLAVVAAQVNRWPLDKLQGMFGGSIATTPPKIGSNQQAIHRWTLSGVSGAGLMMTLYPLLFSKRQAQICKVLAEWKSREVVHRFRTHCPQGHAYTPENTRISRGARRCRECGRERDRLRAPRRRSR